MPHEVGQASLVWLVLAEDWSIFILGRPVLKGLQLLSNAGDRYEWDLLKNVLKVIVGLVHVKFEELCINIGQVNRLHLTWWSTWVSISIIKAEGTNSTYLLVLCIISRFYLPWIVRNIEQLYSGRNSEFMWEYLQSLQSYWSLELQYQLLRIGAEFLWAPALASTSSLVLNDVLIVYLNARSWATRVLWTGRDDSIPQPCQTSSQLWLASFPCLLRAFIIMLFLRGKRASIHQGLTRSCQWWQLASSC